jgi:hypothetical protein
MRDEVKKQIVNINLPDMDDDFFLLNGKEFLDMLYEVEALLDGDNESTGLNAIIDKMLELFGDDNNDES